MAKQNEALRRVLQSVLMLAVSFGLVIGTSAANTVWTGDGDGTSWNDPLNWDDGLPDALKNADFGPGGDITVTFPGEGVEYDAFAVRITVGGQTDITFQLNGNTLKTHRDSWDLNLRSDGENSRDLTLLNGTVDVKGLTLPGSAAAPATSTLTIGADATLKSQGRFESALVPGSFSEIHVLANGTLDLHDLTYIGKEGTSRLLVDGSNATVNLNDRPLYLGHSTNSTDYHANGTLEIRNGEVIGVRRIYFAVGGSVAGGQRPEGHVLVTGTTSKLEVNGSIEVGDWPWSDSDGIGTITIRDGGSITLAKDSDQARLNSLFDDGSSLEIDGGTMTTGGGMDFYDGSMYKLTLHDAEATPLDVKGDVFLRNGGDGVALELSLKEEFDGQIGQVYTVLNYSESINGLAGTFSNFEDEEYFMLSEGGNDHYFQFFYNYNDEGQIAVAVIPEPQTLGLILLGVASVAVRRFRRL